MSLIFVIKNGVSAVREIKIQDPGFVSSSSVSVICFLLSFKYVIVKIKKIKKQTLRFRLVCCAGMPEFNRQKQLLVD